MCGIHSKISNISRIKSQNLNDACLVLQLPLPSPLKPVLSRESRAAPTGVAPTTSEWSTILLPTQVWLI